MNNNKSTQRKPFNFGNAPIIQATEETVVNGYNAIEQREKSGGEQPMDAPINQEPVAPAIVATGDKGYRSINIELPLALHTRLKIACASQNRKIKDIVPEIIAAWVDQVEK